MSIKLALGAVVALAAPLIASAQTLPTGTLAINGYFQSTYIYGSCDGTIIGPGSGYLFNPGPNKPGTEIQFDVDYNDNNDYGSGDVVTVSGFPAQPPTGLNGWTAADPVRVTQNVYFNGALIQSSTLNASFTLLPISNRTSQGSILLTNGECPETVKVILNSLHQTIPPQEYHPRGVPPGSN
jgi:hypothetical protein